jgi:hypothetical protein
MNDRDVSGRHDGPVDAKLRNVPVPAGIAGRMAVESLFDDAAIDRLLAAVSVPSGLAPRVRRSLAQAGDERLLSTAPVPDRGGPARRAGRPRGAAVRVLRELLLDGAALAAALTIVVGMFMAGTALSRRLAPATGRETGPQAAPVAAAARPPAAARTNRPAPRAADQASVVAETAPPALPPATARLASPDAPNVGGDGSAEPAAAATARRPATVRAAPPPAAPDGLPARRGRGAAVRTVLLPEATRKAPRSAGYDLAFEMAHGEAPFVDPRVPGLDLDRPPLSVRCDSFDMIAVGLGAGGRAAAARPRRGDPAAARVEEFLAAVSPPAPEDEAAATEQAGVRLSVGAMRSLRAHPETMLVELCATAGPLPAVAPPDAVGGWGALVPLDACVVIDQSSGPGTAVAWQWACRGLARLASQMQDADRVSVVVCGERPRLAALRVDAAGLSLLAEELRREPPAGAADIDAGLRLVRDVAGREGPPRRTVVLAHAGSLEQCRGEARSAVAAWQAARAGTADGEAAAGVRFVRIDPQQPVAERPAADSGGVQLDGVAVARALVAQVLGRSTLVAGACRMEVRFNPDLVGAYRIVGHRQAAADVLSAGAAPVVDLHSGETVRVVYELVRRPGAAVSPTQEIVTATLRWTPALENGETSARVGLSAARGARSGGDPIPSPHACEILLAMGLGEWLAGSVHAEPRRQFAAAVAGLARACRDRARLHPTLARLVEGLEQEGVRPADR